MAREIASTGALVERLHSQRAQTFTTMARLIADAPTLRAAVDTDDPPTVQANADGYRAQIDSSLLLITNASGRMLASVGAPRALVVANEPAVRRALALQESVSLLPQPEGILQLVTVPIAVGRSQPDVLGTLSVGFLLDDGFATQLKEITGSDVAFEIDRHIVAATLTAEQRQALAGDLPDSDAAGYVWLAGDDFAVRRIALEARDEGDRSHRAAAWILRSRTDQQRFLQAIHTELAVTAIVAVALATILSFTVARTITRPLAAITDAMREVAATGDLTRTIVLGDHRWTDEDARLLATTFNTLTESVTRVQREMGQKERLSSLGRLSTVIAHEIRNPLMIIKAALHSLRRGEVTPAALREAAADIDGEVVRLNRIVNEVLDFARPIPFELGEVDPEALCRESAAAAQATAGVPIDLAIDGPLPHITSDGERLRAALVNLLMNARQAVEGSERPGSVKLEARATDGTVDIVVSDRGAGIAPADLARVFDPYFTTKRGGTGLGLPIAKNIVEGLGGTLTVRSGPGQGTHIEMRLPRTAPGATSRPLSS
jgi:signal transduction histidine kinase